MCTNSSFRLQPKRLFRAPFVVLIWLFSCAYLTAQEASVLAQGQWIKMSFSESGVYKIDHSTLTSMGIDPSSINPQNIAIYGNGGGMLPQSNATDRPQDLYENSISVIGESDGVFNSEDYILFYVDEVDKRVFDRNSGRFSIENNLYSDDVFYYLTIKTTNAKRLGQNIDLGNGFQAIESYDRIIWHEEDIFNILGSGREWFGEQMNGSNTLSFDLQIADIIPNTEATIQVSLMAQSFTNSSIDVLLGQQPLGEVRFNPIINARYTKKGDTKNAVFTVPTESILSSGQLGFTYDQGGSTSALAYLNNYLVQLPTSLTLRSSQMSFRSVASTRNTTSTFSIRNASAESQVWDVSDPLNPRKQESQLAESVLSFGAFSDELKEYVVFNPTEVELVNRFSTIVNQNLHGLTNTDFIIITASEFESEANRLANFRKNTDGLNVAVVTTNEVYNEFGSGKPDPTAIRDFVRHLFENQNLRYLLLFGKGSYDYKERIANNTNFVPTYEARNSLDPLASYSSDDFFGFLDPDEGEWIENTLGDHLLDIGIGRIPATNISEAKTAVDKIINYQSSLETFGDWRTKLMFVADDGDNNIHQRDADQLATLVDTTYASFNVEKLYLDAFDQERRPNGEFSPEAQRALLNSIDDGVLVLNFTGHGAETGWMQERVLTLDLIDQMTNINTLPLLVTATCEFGRNDDPNIVSGAEKMMFKSDGGAVALITTARPVFSSTNYDLNLALYGSVLERENGQYARLGDIIRFTKNNSLNGSLNRNFILLGDPSMRLSYPGKDISINTINGSVSDTIRALERVVVTGEIQEDGIIDEQFNGTVNFSLTDKVQQRQTKGTESSIFYFNERNSILFKGSATVENGEFSIEFIIPQNIDYSWGNGKISLYAMDDSRQVDAIGSKVDFIIGGTGENLPQDNTPPSIEPYLNDTLASAPYFVKPNSTLLLKLSDASGINISQAGIGQEITAILNDSVSYNLNSYYTTTQDDFTTGWVEFPLRNLPLGQNRLEIKAWDNYNNSSISSLEFIVNNESSTLITNLSNYPNPFLGSTTFSIEHNGAGEELEMVVEVFNSKGEKITSLYRAIDSAKSVEEISWNGSNFEGAELSKGIYIYNVFLRSQSTGKTASQRKKLIISN